MAIPGTGERVDGRYGGATLAAADPITLTCACRHGVHTIPRPYRRRDHPADRVAHRLPRRPRSGDPAGPDHRRRTPRASPASSVDPADRLTQPHDDPGHRRASSRPYRGKALRSGGVRPEPVDRTSRCQISPTITPTRIPWMCGPRPMPYSPLKHTRWLGMLGLGPFSDPPVTGGLNQPGRA